MPCPIHGLRCRPITPEGDGSLGVLIVGEAAGATEAMDGLPFRPRGESGAVLERAWRRLGLSRNQFRITNCVLCQPPGNKLEGMPYRLPAIIHYRPALDQEVERMKPRAILALGGTAAEVLTGMSGRKKGISSIRGYILDSIYPGIPCIPSFHPAFLRRGKMAWLGILINDIALAVRVAREGRPRPAPLGYKPYATVEEARAFLETVKEAASNVPVL